MWKYPRYNKTLANLQKLQKSRLQKLCKINLGGKNSVAQL